jgi:asparagine synthase (glutamine-hydrolysing)
MFAFAIWDNIEKTLFIARDRIGKKPLYYFNNKHYFVFSSEIDSLLALGIISPEINFEAFEHQIFATSFIETNLERTLVKHIYSLPAGSYLTIANNKKPNITKYWEIPGQGDALTRNNKNLIDELEYLLSDSIKLRLISDVPISAFLSGGIDSSLINYYALKQTRNKLNSITINYSEGGRDIFTESEDMDLKFSCDFVNLFKESIDHKIVTLLNSDVTVKSIDDITDLSCIADDDRLLSIYKNYECVKNSGFKVVLNGQGADEIMCGYIGLKYFYETMFDIQNPQNELISKMYPARTIAKSILNYETTQKADKYYSNIYNYYRSLSGTHNEKIHKFLINTQLARILKFEDYLSMQNSIECRAPFLDYRIIEFAFTNNLDIHCNPSSREGKVLLREIAKKRISESVGNRPKQAFPSSLSNGKFQQLLNIFNYNQNEILNCTTISNFYDLKKLNFAFTNESYHELWLILSIWRWEIKLKKHYQNVTSEHL